MEGHDDDATRCLPKMPKLFTTPGPQPEVVLYSALTNDSATHGIAACDADDEDKREQNSVQVEEAPKNALYSTLMMFTIGEAQPSREYTTLPPTSDISINSDDHVPDEAIQRLTNAAKKVRNLAAGSKRNRTRTLEEDPIKSGQITPKAQDQSPQPLTRSRLKSIPEAKLYSLGAIYSRLKDGHGDSQDATIRSDSPRPADLDAESVSTFEAPEASSEAEYPAYYIFDPHSGGLAYYMYQNADTEDDYKIEKVSFKLASPKPGVLSYHIEASEKDQNEPRHSSHETPWRFDPSNAPAVVLDSESSASFEAEDNTWELLYAGDEATQSIAKKVSDRLQKLRHLREHLHAINGQGQYVREAKGLYLIGDKDIRDVVRIVLDETKMNEHAHEPERTTSESTETLPMPRLDANSRSILVPSPTTVDPATTISLPRTSYANINATDMQVHTQTRGAGSDATTTVITRKSVAEITWAQAYPKNHDSDSRTHCRAVSDCCSPIHGGSRLCPDDRRQSQPTVVQGDFILRHYDTPKSTAEILADIMCNKSFEQQQRISDGTVITSFPRLFSRDFTTEQLSSPTCNEELNEAIPSTPYFHGVNAHRDNDETILSGSPGESPKPFRHGSSHFDTNPFYSNSSNWATQNQGLSNILAAERRLSASLNADTQRRRSTQVAGVEEEMLDTHDGPRPSLLDKIRQGSHKFFHRNHFRKSTGVPSATAEEDVPQENSAMRSRDSIMRQVTPQPPSPDDSGIYEAMTGSRVNILRQKKCTCSEDNQPHVCVDDLSSGRINDSE
ncbi:hypothetical protein NW762_009944 [Fusarium torreyae]|uniref:Uncharacterized protein n=1 Tax=Fusarium torreyae TaxID=1237075 RepID=A0A9W8RVX7_9HYPO|nr:hypothetical protein NW762_009944 [Fusarium torreyae]